MLNAPIHVCLYVCVCVCARVILRCVHWYVFSSEAFFPGSEMIGGLGKRWGGGRRRVDKNILAAPRRDRFCVAISGRCETGELCLSFNFDSSSASVCW